MWSSGVTLYVMLVGAYPFQDPAEPNNFRNTICVRVQISRYYLLRLLLLSCWIVLIELFWRLTADP